MNKIREFFMRLLGRKICMWCDGEKMSPRFSEEFWPGDAEVEFCPCCEGRGFMVVDPLGPRLIRKLNYAGIWLYGKLWDISQRVRFYGSTWWNHGLKGIQLARFSIRRGGYTPPWVTREQRTPWAKYQVRATDGSIIWMSGVNKEHAQKRADLVPFRRPESPFFCKEMAALRSVYSGRINTRFSANFQAALSARKKAFLEKYGRPHIVASRPMA